MKNYTRTKIIGFGIGLLAAAGIAFAANNYNILDTPTGGGGGGAVNSVFGRAGTVSAQSGDYSFSQIGTTPTTISGYGITDALVKTSNLSDVSSVSTSRTNLGLLAIASSGSATDITSGTLACARTPALTSDITTSAGSCATTIKNDVSLAGNPTTTTQTAGNNTTRVATTAFVQAAIAGGTAGVASFAGRTGIVVPTTGDYAVGDVTGAAPLLSPTFTGTPTAPTAANGTNTTQLATTAFVLANSSASGVSSFNSRTGAVVPANGDYAIGNLAAIADQTIVGNNSGGSGVPLALTATQVKTVLAIANTDVSGLGTASTQNSTAFLAATASAGGDLAGNYPNPTVGINKVNDDKMSPLMRPNVAAVADTNTTPLSGGVTIDGFAVSTGAGLGARVVLLTAQTTTTENGYWVVNSGAWTRPTWSASGTTLTSSTMSIARNGTKYAGSWWRLTTTSAIVDTNAQTWVQIATAMNSTTFTGTLPATQFPALTGDVTTAGGALATTIASSVALAGNPTTTTQAGSDNSTRIATTAFVQGLITGSGVSSFNARTGAVVPVAGDYDNLAIAPTTMSASGDVSAGSNAGTTRLVKINSAAANARSISYQTAGVKRFDAGASAGSETGSNAGSNYVINSYDDSGTSIDLPFVIIRASTGTVTVGAATRTTNIPGPLTPSVAGAASTPAELLAGAWFTGGSATTTKPQLSIEPTGTTSTGWSTSGTGLGVNAASGFVGNLVDYQVAGVSKAKVDSAGTYRGGGGVVVTGNNSFTSGSLTASGGTISLNASSNSAVNISTGTTTTNPVIGGTANKTEVKNQVRYSGAAFTVGSGVGDCGTSPTVAGSDGAGRVTVGSSTNGGVCTVTFAATWTTKPVCFAMNETSQVTRSVTWVTTTTTLAITGTTTLSAADVLAFSCVGY